MAAITRQWWRRLVNAYEVKGGYGVFAVKSCVIHTWALLGWRSHEEELYKCSIFTFYLLNMSLVELMESAASLCHLWTDCLDIAIGSGPSANIKYGIAFHHCSVSIDAGLPLPNLSDMPQKPPMYNLPADSNELNKLSNVGKVSGFHSNVDRPSSVRWLLQQQHWLLSVIVMEAYCSQFYDWVTFGLGRCVI